MSLSNLSIKQQHNMKEEKQKQRIDKLVLNITAPIKINQEIEFSQIAILVGHNSSGKSLMLKVAFALGAISCCPLGVTNPPGMSAIQMAQFVFDNTFKEQNFNGSLKALYTKGSVSVELDNGKVTSATVDVENPVPVMFMSTDMRTFDSMSVYLQIRKKVANDPTAFAEQMLAAYRLYDVSYMEGLISRCPITVDKSLRSSLKSFDIQEPIASIEVDLDKCTFRTVLDNGEKKDITTYGKGQQAMLNMLVASGI